MKELKLAGVIDIEAANAFIRETYLPAHSPVCEGLGLHAHSGRRSRRDPVRAGGASGHERQLRVLPDAETADPRKPNAAPLRQGAVKVHVYRDGSHALFYGPRCIGRYDQNGAIRNAKNAA